MNSYPETCMMLFEKCMDVKNWLHLECMYFCILELKAVSLNSVISKFLVSFPCIYWEDSLVLYKGDSKMHFSSN